MMTMRTFAAAVLLVLTIGGCAAKPPADARPGGRRAATTTTTAGAAAALADAPPSSNLDPCAMRLHDLCAPLLLYYGANQTFPASAAELGRVPGFDDVPLVCPVSSQPYVYSLHGPSGPDPGSRIILYDADPVHAGRRWGIAVQEPAPGQAPVAKVVVVPESIFSPP